MRPLIRRQVMGRQWTGPKPRRPHFVGECAGCVASILSRPVDHKGFGIEPGGRLATLLGDPRVTRPLRRKILAVLQMPAVNKNQKRLERAISRELTALGVPA